jgi:hypothetical protein
MIKAYVNNTFPFQDERKFLLGGFCYFLLKDDRYEIVLPQLWLG